PATVLRSDQSHKHSPPAAPYPDDSAARKKPPPNSPHAEPIWNSSPHAHQWRREIFAADPPSTHLPPPPRSQNAYTIPPASAKQNFQSPPPAQQVQIPPSPPSQTPYRS